MNRSNFCGEPVAELPADLVVHDAVLGKRLLVRGDFLENSGPDFLVPPGRRL